MRKLNSGIVAMGIIFVLAILIGGVVNSLSAEDLSKAPPVKKYHPKMESTLGELVEKYTVEGRVAAQSFAQQRGILFEDDRVRVILEALLDEDVSAIDQAYLSSLGATIEASYRHLLQVKIPVNSLQEVAEKVSGIRYIRLPLIPLPLVTSEGVELTCATTYHNNGYEGQNTKVAIIDLGFIGLAAAQAAGELPPVTTVDYTGTGMEADTVHGTGVAEIVYDMAPSAGLYLIKIGTEVHLGQAKDWCVNQGIDIINHSVGWVNFNFTDGTGTICDIANDARSQGILWVNAAGNSAQRHYQDFFTDADGDDWHEFASDDEGNTIIHNGGWVAVFLTWDDWPTTDQDYDLYLYDATGNLVAGSTNLQTGTQPPTEAIYETLPAGTYFIAIKEYSATTTNELKIFTFYHDLEHQTPEHSLMNPADATGVMSVAAIDQANWYTGPQESFSSQGPTNDGRVKPDISGPDGVSTFTYGITNFYGTSASSPHVAGAAALVLSRYSVYTADQLQSYLENFAADIGTPGKDSIYGSGRLRLAVVPGLEGLVVYPNPFKSAEHTEVIFSGLTEEVKIRIFTLSGELVREVDLSGESSWSWDVKNEQGEEVARGIYLYLVTNPAGEKVTGKIAIIKER